MKTVRRQLFNDINITPLTDIFLVLLIIMMVVAPLLDYRGLDMVVTAGAATDTQKKDLEAKRIWVVIEANGQYKLDDNVVNPADLAAAIQKQIPEKPEGVVIEADPESTHAALAHAIEAAQVAGASSVSVIEKPGATTAPAANQTPATAPPHKKAAKKK